MKALNNFSARDTARAAVDSVVALGFAALVALGLGIAALGFTTTPAAACGNNCQPDNGWGAGGGEFGSGVGGSGYVSGQSYGQADAVGNLPGYAQSETGFNGLFTTNGNTCEGCPENANTIRLEGFSYNAAGARSEGSGQTSAASQVIGEAAGEGFSGSVGFRSNLTPVVTPPASEPDVD